MISAGVITYEPVIAIVFIVIFLSNLVGTVGAYMHERKHAGKAEKAPVATVQEKRQKKEKKLEIDKSTPAKKE